MDEVVSSILVQEGFSSLEEVAYVPANELIAIEEFNEEIVTELRARARDVLITQAIVTEEVLDQSEPAEDLLSLDGMDRGLRIPVGQPRYRPPGKIWLSRRWDDIEDIEFLEPERAGSLIMAARAHWFEDEA